MNGPQVGLKEETMVTPEQMSVGCKAALQDLVELQMYLVAQTQQTPWPMCPRTRKNPLDTRKAHSNPVEVSVVWELLDLGFIEASSSRTFIVSNSGREFYERQSVFITG
jgi:hypothetical protein